MSSASDQQLTGPLGVRRRTFALEGRLHVYFLMMTLGVIALILDFSTVVTESVLFIALMLMLGAFLTTEVVALARCCPCLWVINPVTIASLLVFGLGFVVPGILAFLPFVDPSEVGFPDDVDHWITKHAVLALIASVAMWIGYRSPYGANIANAASRLPLRAVLRRDSAIRPTTVLILFAVSLAGRLLLIGEGVFGYSTTPEDLERTIAYREYLGAAASLGSVALVALSIATADPERGRSPFMGIALACVLGGEMSWGFLSGFKSAVVLPVVTVGVCFYVMRRRFKWWLVAGPVVATLAAYSVIEPFRIARYEDTGFVGTSVSYIFNLIVDSSQEARQSEGRNVSLQFVSRGAIAAIGAEGIWFADTGEMPSDAPGFVSDLLLTPLLAFVPRAVWPDKPVQRLGAWYNIEVLGNNTLTSVGMGPVTYLYFAGGVVGVILGFLFVGIMQRVFFEGLSTAGAGGLTLLIVVLPVVGNINSYVPGIVIWLLRYFVPLLILQRAVFRK